MQLVVFIHVSGDLATVVDEGSTARSSRKILRSLC